MQSSQAVSLARADLKKGHKPQQVAEKLAQLACRRHTTDNVAVVIVDLGGGVDGWTRSSRKRGSSGKPTAAAHSKGRALSPPLWAGTTSRPRSAASLAFSELRMF